MSAVEKVVPIRTEEKVCKGCKQSKDLDSYDKHSVSAQGVRSYCKECRHEQYLSQKDHQEDLRKTVQLTEDGRVCVACNKPKSWDSFVKDVWGFKEKSATCKDCRNAVRRAKYPEKRRGLKERPDRLMRLYGITYEQVIYMLGTQLGLCANTTCKKPINIDVQGTTTNRAVIDHDHNTGRVRALLCSPCNLLLGTLETKKDLLTGLSEYLTKYNRLE